MKQKLDSVIALIEQTNR